MRTRTLHFEVTPRAGAVTGLLALPQEAASLLVLAHGAGAGMGHVFMESFAQALASEGVGTLRYQFPYAEAGRRRPDPPAVLVATVRAAVTAARTSVPQLPLLAGGKSMGGRMTSLAAAEDALEGVVGLVFAGFPLHAAGRPGTERAGHLSRVPHPMLFLQGTRDRLADLDLLRGALRPLGRATLHVIPDADHGFHVPKRTGRNDKDVIAELAATTRAWFSGLDQEA